MHVSRDDNHKINVLIEISLNPNKTIPNIGYRLKRLQMSRASLRSEVARQFWDPPPAHQIHSRFL
jgi:hypothetical protein